MQTRKRRQKEKNPILNFWTFCTRRKCQISFTGCRQRWLGTWDGQLSWPCFTCTGPVPRRTFTILGKKVIGPRWLWTTTQDRLEVRHIINVARLILITLISTAWKLWQKVRRCNFWFMNTGQTVVVVVHKPSYQWQLRQPYYVFRGNIFLAR